MDGDLLAILTSSGNANTGTTFLSPGHFPLQVSLMIREASYKVEAHVHTHQERHISFYQEFLFVRSGKINV